MKDLINKSILNSNNIEDIGSDIYLYFKFVDFIDKDEVYYVKSKSKFKKVSLEEKENYLDDNVLINQILFKIIDDNSFYHLISLLEKQFSTIWFINCYFYAKGKNIDMNIFDKMNKESIIKSSDVLFSFSWISEIFSTYAHMKEKQDIEIYAQYFLDLYDIIPNVLAKIKIDFAIKTQMMPYMF